jgi:hypothetical protein
MWIALALGAAGIMVVAAVALLFLALHGHPSSSSAPQAIEPEHTSAPVATTTVAPEVELAPLRPLTTTQQQQQQQQTAPPVRTSTRPPPFQAPTQQTTRSQTPNPPPTATQTQKPPDIF